MRIAALALVAAVALPGAALAACPANTLCETKQNGLIVTTPGVQDTVSETKQNGLIVVTPGVQDTLSETKQNGLIVTTPGKQDTVSIEKMNAYVVVTSLGNWKVHSFP